MQNIFQKRSLIISAIFFILSCSTFVFFYRMVNTNKEASLLVEEKWQTEEIRRNSVRSLASFLDGLTEERTLIDAHFVKGSDVVPFLDTVEELAKDVKVSAEIVSVNVSKDNSSLMIELKTAGTFEAIYKFILLLENSPYSLSFISADIKNLGTIDVPNTKTVKPPEWAATFQIKVLSFINE